MTETEELVELRALVKRMREVIPYVTATLGSAVHGGFYPEKIRGFYDPTDTKDWGVVHKGRAHSSYVQLENLEIIAKSIATKKMKCID